MKTQSSEERLQSLENVAISYLVNINSDLTPGLIRETAADFGRSTLINATDEECEVVARRIEAKLGVTMSAGTVLTEDDYEPWLHDARKDIDQYYWGRYRKLIIQLIGSRDVVSKMDEVTDKIVGLMENPAKPGAWDRRGLVMGHVQSGKTANYIASICKAADAGYRVIIVIAGIHNNLRSQTQQRIDEGFVGRDSARMLTGNRVDRFIGVGNHDRSRVPASFTTTARDFNRSIATSANVPLFNLKEPAIFVIKKNASTLRNLIEWLKEHSAKAGQDRIYEPMLLVDDEADNASINVMYGKDEVSRINGQLRQLLNLFDRSCYLGYTATPFANIFVDPDSQNENYESDLFPRDFIVSLDPPSNYFGPRKIFLDFERARTHLIEIEDNNDLLPVKHKIDWDIHALPPSLRNAIRAFILARAIRLVRGDGKAHCSMLVNASRFTAVQSQLRSAIHLELDQIKHCVATRSALDSSIALKDPEIAHLHKVWLELYESESSWEAIQKKLHESASAIQVVEVNSRSTGSLDYANYKNGLNVIAIGGFSLSRGLTLEGLMISYFLRNSMMYDTLMQMGRWFGFRPGYEDLCRIWMPEYAIGWYEHVSESIEMLRDELREMEKSKATPREFGLKVRSHPDSLIVTARNKMGTGKHIVMNIGLGNRFVETTNLRRDAEALMNNIRLVNELAKNLIKDDILPRRLKRVENGWLLQDVPVETILGFVRGFLNHRTSILSEPGPITSYIADRSEDELKDWDVLLASISRQKGKVDKTFGVDIFCQKRTVDKKQTDDQKIRFKKQRVSSRGIEKTGLTEKQKNLAERKWEEDPESQPGKDGKYNYPDHIYRGVRSKPLFILHLIDIVNENDVSICERPVVVWSISFPSTAKEEKTTEYVVNTTWLQEHFRDELDDDIEEDAND